MFYILYSQAFVYECDECSVWSKSWMRWWWCRWIKLDEIFLILPQHFTFFIVIEHYGFLFIPIFFFLHTYKFERLIIYFNHSVRFIWQWNARLKCNKFQFDKFQFNRFFHLNVKILQFLLHHLRKQKTPISNIFTNYWFSEAYANTIQCQCIY